MSSETPRLLVLDAAYSLAEIEERGLQQSITSRDLGGFFQHVWSVHPLGGASYEHRPVPGAIRTRRLAPSHTFVEAPVARFGFLRNVPLLNFACAQVSLLWWLHRLIRRERISAVRVGDPYYLGLLGLWLARLHRIPLVVRINGNYDAIYEATGKPAYPRLFRSRRVEKKIDRFVLSRADLVGAANQNNLDFAIANGARAERSTLFRYGNLIDPVHFDDPSDRSGVREELALPAEVPLLIYVGRLEEVKHPDHLLLVLSLVEYRPAPHLLLVGDGSMRVELARKTQQLSIQDRVTFVGSKDQRWIARALADAAAVLSPLTGRALVEATLSATPIVAYDVEWHSELIQHEVDGILVPNGDYAAMARAVDRLLSHPEVATTLGSAGRARALRMMDPEDIAAHEREAYAHLLARPFA